MKLDKNKFIVFATILFAKYKRRNSSSKGKIMKNKIVFIIAYCLIHNPIVAMNSESQKAFTAYKDFLDNVNTFLSHPADQKNNCLYLKKAQENATFLISNINPISPANKTYKKKIDTFLDIKLCLLCNEPNEIFLSKLRKKILNHIKDLKKRIDLGEQNLDTLKQIENDLVASYINIPDPVIFWQKIQNDFKSIYGDKNKTSVPAAIKTLLVINIAQLSQDPQLNNFLYEVKKSISFLYFDKYPDKLYRSTPSTTPQSKLQEYGIAQATKNFFTSVGDAARSTINRITNFFTPTAQQ